MDNNNDFNRNNDFYTQPPQKPFTDRGGANDEAQSLPNGVSGDAPVQPAEAAQEGVNTAAPDFSDETGGKPAFNANQASPEPAFNPNDVQNPGANGRQFNTPNTQAGGSFFGSRPNYYTQAPYPAQDFNRSCAPPQYPSGMPYGFQPQPAAKKSSTGLIVLVTILVLLCVGCFTVSLAAFYSQAPSSDGGSQSLDNPYNFGTLPDEEQDEESSSEPNHPESDCSSVANEDYEGLKQSGKPKDKDSDKYDSEYAVSRVSSSVVGVLCYLEDDYDPEKPDSQGSGIIISSDGFVITNSHVIDNSKTNYIVKIATEDGKTYDAGIVGYDERTDIAVIKMYSAEGLSAATFGKSSEISLGEDAIVVGNPGGIDFQNSVTKGIISAVGREVSSTSMVKYIQTDAAINPGNSGGPLINMYGQVIGVATSKIVSERYEGMGFAIPIDEAKKSIDSIIRYGYVKGRVKIGISGYSIDGASYGIDGVSGIYVTSVSENGPCDGSGIEEGCIITEVNGAAIDNFADVYEILEEFEAGDTIEISYVPQDGASITDEKIANVTLQENK